MKEQNDMRGLVTLRLCDRQGRLVHHQRQRNRIVTTGRRLVAQLFAGQVAGVPPTAVSHMGVGTDDTAPSDADAALGAARDPRKVVSDVDYSEINDSGVERIRVRLTSVFDFAEANGTDPLQEAGIFTAETGGVMYNRVVFQPVTKTNAFQLTLLWDIVF